MPVSMRFDCQFVGMIIFTSTIMQVSMLAGRPLLDPIIAYLEVLCLCEWWALRRLLRNFTLKSLPLGFSLAPPICQRLTIRAGPSACAQSSSSCAEIVNAGEAAAGDWPHREE